MSGTSPHAVAGSLVMFRKRYHLLTGNIILANI